MCAPVKSVAVVHLDKATTLRRCKRRKIDDPGLNVLLQIPILNVIYQLFMLAVAAAASHIHNALRYVSMRSCIFQFSCGVWYITCVCILVFVQGLVEQF